MVDRQDTTFIKDGETNVITKRGLLYIEGYHLVEMKKGIVRVYDQIPRNAIGEFFDWVEEFERDFPGLFWSFWTLVFGRIAVWLGYFTYELYECEPWTTTLSAGEVLLIALVIIEFIAFAVFMAVCAYLWIREGFIPWIGDMWTKMTAKAKA